MRISVKAVPGASRDEIVGLLGTELKVRVQAPATDGRANERLCEFLAERLDLPKNAVKLVSGASSRRKILEIDGIGQEETLRRLGLAP